MAPRHLFLMFIICLVWGFTFVAGKAGVSEMPPMLFTALRYVLLALLLVPFLEIVEGKMPQVVFISLTMGSLHFALFYGGMSVASNVSSIAVAVQLSVPISTIMSIVFLNEQVGWRRWLGIAMSFGGVVVISFDPAIINERLGLFMVIGAAFIGSVGMIIMKQIHDTGVYQMQAWIADDELAAADCRLSGVRRRPCGGAHPIKLDGLGWSGLHRCRGQSDRPCRHVLSVATL